MSNVTEKRAVLHVALPAPKNARIGVEDRDVVPEVHAVLDRTAAFSHQIRSGEWRGNTGNRQRNVINICIGGSDLGPIMACELQRHYSQRDMTFRFCSNVDGTDCSETKDDLDLEGMLFIVCSKLFTKLEALTNAHSARAWRLRKFGDERAIAKHFVEASANAGEVTKSGIDPEHMFAFFGIGRGALLDGLGDRVVDHDRHRRAENVRAMHAGFIALDEHFRRAPFDRNLPTIKALLAIWNYNFIGTLTIAVLPNERYLKRPPAYLQLLTMESNGKHVARVDYQGTRMVPCDRLTNTLIRRHRRLRRRLS